MFHRPLSILLAAALTASLPIDSIAAETGPPPNVQLLSAVTEFGGGRRHFDARTFRLRFLRAGIGCKDDSNATQSKFDQAFTYLVTSSTRNMSLPAPPTSLDDAASLQAALRAAGTHNGVFDIERLFSTLFGMTPHVRGMMEVAQKYGSDSLAAYHTVFTEIVTGSCIAHQGHNHDLAMKGMTMSASPAPRVAGANPMPSGMVMQPSTAGTPTPNASMAPGMTMQEGMRGMAVNGETLSLKGMHEMPAMEMTVQQMPDTTDLAVGMSREGSGTSWMPDASPVYARMWMKGDDMWMQHGAAWLNYAHTGSDRGSNRLTIATWYMMMLAHPISTRSQIGFRAMVSADPALVGGSGYPLLFQTGETWHNQPLHDRQHPHDLFDELSATYSAMIGTNTSAALYVGHPGEPALGPPAFMHRAIAYDLFQAPIGHHWQDATHITFGVATLGVGTTRFKVEGSLFNGREPDEVRTNLDPIRFDSSSERLSWNPNAFTAVQVSSGYIKSMEAADPNLNLHRTTASVQYERPYGISQWSQALVWGQNDESGLRTNSYLYEADYATRSGSIFGRLERAQKTGKDLVLKPALNDNVYTIGAYTLGYVRNLPSSPNHPVFGIGAQVTVNSRPSSLNAFYGSGTPVSYDVFLRLRGPRMFP